MNAAPRELRRRATTTLALLAALGQAGCHGAPQPSPAKPPADAQSSFEPRSAPGAGQQFLARMVGEWSVEKTIHRRNGGEPVATSGTCHQEMIHDGRFLRSDFVFDGDGANQGNTGTGIIGFDAATGTFTSFWIDSRSTRVSVRQSNGDFDGDRIQLQSRTIGEDKTARTSRTLTEFDVDGRIVHRQWSRNNDGSERLVMELRMTRKSAAS